MRNSIVLSESSTLCEGAGCWVFVDIKQLDGSDRSTSANNTGDEDEGPQKPKKKSIHPKP